MLGFQPRGSSRDPIKHLKGEAIWDIDEPPDAKEHATPSELEIKVLERPNPHGSILASLARRDRSALVAPSRATADYDRVVSHSLFLPYADQDRPPLNVHSVCRELEASLDALSVDTEQETSGGQIGIRISSSRVDSPDQLWAAVEPVLPAGVFAGPCA